MKRLTLALSVILLSVAAVAQASTRSVVLSWTASTSSSVTGYAVYFCTVVSPAVSCTPSTTGTPLATVTTTTYTATEAVGAGYGYSVVAQAPACGPTTPLTTPCGSAPAAVITYVPVPPQVAGASNLVIVVP